jgi:uncharacterized LabA/DUF88 family protein
MSTGLFIDVANLYFCVKKRFAGRKIDYNYLYGHFTPLACAHAYGVRLQSEAKAFIRNLNQQGYTTRFIKTAPKRHTSLNVDITIDVVKRASKLNTIILGTADRDILPLVKWLHDQGIKVIIVGCGIPAELQYSEAECIEITEDYLEINNATTTSINTE